LRLGEDRKQRIDARFDRPLAQQLGAEAVDRVDVGFLERFERVLETLRTCSPAARARSCSSASRNRSLARPRLFP
jgi:hypothetical protein